MEEGFSEKQELGSLARKLRFNFAEKEGRRETSSPPILIHAENELPTAGLIAAAVHQNFMVRTRASFDLARGNVMSKFASVNWPYRYVLLISYAVKMPKLL